MGFPYFYYCVFLPKPVALLVLLLDCLLRLVADGLRCIGFLSYDLVPGSSETTPITPSSVKVMLPVVEFACIDGSEEEEKGALCAVCLGELMAWHEVRQLGNCRHTFHKGCMDKWVDLGRLTCPLCRSQLMPTSEELKNLLLVSEGSSAAPWGSITHQQMF